VATIKITDELDAELIVANTGPLSGFTKYLKGTAGQIIAGQQLVTSFRQPLALAGTNPIGLGVSFKESLDLGGSETELTIGASARGIVTAHSESGKGVFGEEHFGEPIPVPPGQAYLSFAFAPAIKAGLSREVGDLTFGFEAGRSFEMASYSLFDLTATGPSVGAALKSTIEDFAIPSQVRDLQDMKEGAIAAVSGQGNFKISGSFDAATLVNPLATPNLPLGIGQIAVKAGASLKVGASVRVFGDYQIRVQKTGADTVRLGLHRRKGTELSLEVDASIGASVNVGKRDLLIMLFAALSSEPKVDVQTLVNSELSDSDIETMQKAVKQSLNRSLSLALSAEFSSLKSNEAAFLYEIDLRGLNPASSEALQQALTGNFSALTSNEGSLAGVTMVRSLTGTLREKRFTLKINLLGILNVLSIRDLVREGSLSFEPISGELVIADKITSKKILIVREPFKSDAEKLRKVMFESLLITAAYRASPLAAGLNLKTTHTYFESHAKTNRQAMADNLDAMAAVGLISGRSALPADIEQFGASTFLLEADYDNDACRAVFLDAAGKPRSADEYDKIGRDALLALVQPNDQNSFRRRALSSDVLWKEMRRAGPAALGTVLPQDLRTDQRLPIIRSDYILISWCADSMHAAGEKLAEMNALLKSANPATLNTNVEFQRRREALEKGLARAVSDNQSQFGDPWGLVAMYQAANGKANAKGVIFSKALQLFKMRAVGAGV